MPTATFSGRYESLVRISQFVRQAASAANLDQGEQYQVVLAVEEACANIIDHAYQGEGRGEIRLNCESINGGFRVTLQDRGQPFDPEAIPPPNFSVPLEELKPGGAGLHLIRSLMDEVKFVFGTAEGNVLTMVKWKGGRD